MVLQTRLEVFAGLYSEASPKEGSLCGADVRSENMLKYTIRVQARWLVNELREEV
jgi:hypothetical protein